MSGALETKSIMCSSSGSIRRELADCWRFNRRLLTGFDGILTLSRPQSDAASSMVDSKITLDVEFDDRRRIRRLLAGSGGTIAHPDTKAQPYQIRSTDEP